MKIIVTGGAGFIGSHLVDRLLTEGAEVAVVDNFDSFYNRAEKESNLALARRNPRFRLIELDIRDASGALGVVEECRPHAIVHLAARAGVRPSIADPRLYVEVNVLGTLAYLEAAVRVKPHPRFIYASSSSVYGDRAIGPFRESDPAELPVSPYAASKRACELLAHTFHHLYQLPVTGLRFFTAYGPRNRPDLAIAKFTRLIDLGLPVPMFGDGSSRRDYTYVADIVDGIVRAIDRCESHHLYNLGNSQPIALKNLIDEIAQQLGKPAHIEQLPDQPGDVRQTFAAIELAAAEIGYAPNTPFADGLRQYIDWYRSNQASAKTQGNALEQLSPGHRPGS
jgi:UDP-glucuronate 4-epimerase